VGGECSYALCILTSSSTIHFISNISQHAHDSPKFIHVNPMLYVRIIRLLLASTTFASVPSFAGVTAIACVLAVAGFR